MKKRSVRIAGHATSVFLEEEFWTALKKIAKAHNTSINALIADIDEKRPPGTNLSSAIRVSILNSLTQ